MGGAACERDESEGPGPHQSQCKVADPDDARADDGQLREARSESASWRVEVVGGARADNEDVVASRALVEQVRSVVDFGAAAHERETRGRDAEAARHDVARRLVGSDRQRVDVAAPDRA